MSAFFLREHDSGATIHYPECVPVDNQPILPLWWFYQNPNRTGWAAWSKHVYLCPCQYACVCMCVQNLCSQHCPLQRTLAEARCLLANQIFSYPGLESHFISWEDMAVVMVQIYWQLQYRRTIKHYREFIHFKQWLSRNPLNRVVIENTTITLHLFFICFFEYLLHLQKIHIHLYIAIKLITWIIGWTWNWWYVPVVNLNLYSKPRNDQELWELCISATNTRSVINGVHLGNHQSPTDVQDCTHSGPHMHVNIM